MGYTAVQLTNLALGRIGVRQQVQSLTDDTSSEALAANLVYQPALDATLTDLPWSFAQRYATLALITAGPNSDWAYSYRVPSGCLHVIRVLPASTSGIGRADQSALIPFTISSDTAGLILYTDQEDAVVQYLAQQNDPTYYPSDFALAFAWRLAEELSLVLSVSDQYRATATKMRKQEMDRAFCRMMNEEKRDPLPDAEAIQGRA